MTHTQGRLHVGSGGLYEGWELLTPEGFARARGVAQREDAAELVRRWNAFEPGGAVEQAIEALREFLDFAPRVRSFESENESIANGRPLMASQSEFYMWVIAQARAAIADLAALTEGGR